MKLIVGLGNPGLKYQKTWHNLGFILTDGLKKKHDFSDFKKSEKFKAVIAEGKIGKEKIILAKPLTFMNSSGQAVQLLVNFYKLKPEDVWVAHDEIDLPLGKIRISQNASAAGHNGIKSIIDSLNSKNFIRLRIGIKAEDIGKTPINKYVLQKINRHSIMPANQALATATKAIEAGLADGITAAMNKFN